MLQVHDEPKQLKLLPGRRLIIQISERLLLQPPKTAAQPKIISSGPKVQKPILPENKQNK